MCDSAEIKEGKRNKDNITNDNGSNVVPDKLIQPKVWNVKNVSVMFSCINDLLLEKKLITHPMKFFIHHFIQHIFNFSNKADNRLHSKAEFPLNR